MVSSTIVLKCRQLTAEEVFVIFLDVVYDRACHLHSREQVEVAQDEKNFAVLLEHFALHFLVSEQVILVVVLKFLQLPAILVLYRKVGLEAAISEWKDVVADLDCKQWEVDFS